MSDVELTGLEGTNPLAFMAALGALRVLDDRARAARAPAPRLSWQEHGGWLAHVHGPADVEEVVGAVLEDLPTWRDEPAFAFAYTKGKGGARVAPDAHDAVRDLKPDPEVMRGFLLEQAVHAVEGKGRSARHAAAYGSEVVTDNNGNTKPTALHFTAGQQTFLGAVGEIHNGVTKADFVEALEGPWSRSRPLKTLSWDPMGAFSARMYALRANNPSGDTRPGVPGAEWLAYVGLSFFPTAPVVSRGGRARLETTGVQGGWKDAVLTWPLWEHPATARTIESLLRMPKLDRLRATERNARGITAIVSARILRSDQGGYGAFSPSRVR